MPNRTKHVTLVQEVVRILRNTSRRLPDRVKHTALSTFSFRMKESGYDAATRLKVLQDGLQGYQKQVDREESGTCPLYRPKGYNQESHRKKKALRRVAWYRPHNTVVFIPPTPNSELKKELQAVADKAEEEGGFKIRLVERAGTKLQHLLPGMDNQAPCQEPKCFLHQSGGKGDHRAESVVYRGDCMTCLESGPSSAPDKDGNITQVQERKPGTRAAYIGESGRNALTRGEQHLDAIAAPDQHQENAFARHAKEYHDGEQPQYKFSVLGCHPRPLDRQIWEGVLIRQGEKELNVLLNSKQDHYAPAVGKVVIRNAVGDF